MHTLLSAVGRAFLRVFVSTLITLGPGILSAPSLDSAVLLGVAALMSSVGAGVRAIQQFVPLLSFSKYVGPVYGKYLDAAAQAFIGYLVVAIPNWLHYPTQGNWHLLVAAAVASVITALTRAVQALGTFGESPGPTTGLAVPPGPPKEQHAAP